MSEDPRVTLFEAIYADPEFRLRILALLKDYAAKIGNAQLVSATQEKIAEDDLERMWRL